MTLHRFEVREPTALASTFAAMTRAQVQGLLVLGDSSLNTVQRQIAELAIQHRGHRSAPRVWPSRQGAS